MNPYGSIIKQLFNTSLNIIKNFPPSEYTLLWIMLTPDQVLCVLKDLIGLVGDVRFSYLPWLANILPMGPSLRHRELCRFTPGLLAKVWIQALHTQLVSLCCLQTVFPGFQLLLCWAAEVFLVYRDFYWFFFF